MTETNNETAQTNMDTNQNPTPAAPATPAVAPEVAATAPATPEVAATPATPAPAAVATPAPAKKADTLVIPAGSFTHTDLARANGKTNQQVWTRYQALVKSGTIIRDGERKPAGGKGKPSLLWKLNPNGPNPVPTAPAPVVAAAQPAADNTVVLPTEAQMEAAADATPVVEAAAPAVEPATPAPEPPKDEPPQGGTPVAAEATVTVEVARVEATPEATPAPAVNPATPAETIEEACPACQNHLTAHNDATGVMVGCYQPAAVCPTAEPVEGHGSTLKTAIATLHEKWDKLVGKMTPVAQ